ncbi:hypothetical protein KIPE111705_21090 [Kibdelosporangium persicum]|uniref:Uncharacterized protein n=1 Tax=Kibdelosporangium persicum TaxID=2698649 RepID=A0ABX2FHL6_9PSEU|nr:hypothetical protein [Kibdelosporangium persicum]NRN70355.1 hypothetical protein [Kibdelosporangium persicum]
MGKTTRRATSMGLMAMATVVAGLLTAPAANAASWYSSVPTNATNVETVMEAELGSGGYLQIRRGKYDGRTYLWGRVASPGSTYNSDHTLRFQIGLGCASATTSKDIDRTTYTSATTRDTDCTYFANIIKRSTGKVVKGLQLNNP